MPHVTDKLYHIIEYISPWAGFEITNLVVIDTDCIGNFDCNYPTISTTMAPLPRHINLYYVIDFASFFRFFYWNLQLPSTSLLTRAWRSWTWLLTLNNKYIYNIHCPSQERHLKMQIINNTTHFFKWQIILNAFISALAPFFYRLFCNRRVELLSDLSRGDYKTADRKGDKCGDLVLIRMEIVLKVY
jgi:hypothetical protein